MTDQDKITALRDALQYSVDFVDQQRMGGMSPYEVSKKALAMTAEASEPSGEPSWIRKPEGPQAAEFTEWANTALGIKGWFEIQNSQADVRRLLAFFAWEEATRRATKQASPATDSAPTRRAFDPSPLDIFAERAK